MRRIHLITVVGVILIALIFAYSQAPQSTSRSAQATTEAKRDQVVKAKKVLVTKLPKGVRGIEVKDSQLTLMPGYKFETKDKNKIVVALKSGSPGNFIAIFDCLCEHRGNEKPGGACIGVVENGDGRCIPDPWDSCNGECYLSMRRMGKNLPLAIF